MATDDDDVEGGYDLSKNKENEIDEVEEAMMAMFGEDQIREDGDEAEDIEIEEEEEEDDDGEEEDGLSNKEDPKRSDGYVGSINDARKLLEKIYKDSSYYH